MGRALRLGQARGPTAAAICPTFKILLHLISMYKIERRGGGRSKNRFLGNYPPFIQVCFVASYIQYYNLVFFSWCKN